MKNSIFRHILPMILCAALLIGCAPVFAADGADTYVFPKRTPIPFSEMTADNFDSELIDTVLADIEDVLITSNAFDRLKADYDTIVDQYDRLACDISLAEVYYNFDLSNSEAFEYYSSIAQNAMVYSDRICIALKAALESDYGEEFKTYINSDAVVEELLNYDPMTEEQFELSNLTLALHDRYNNLEPGQAADIAAAEIYLELLDTMIASADFNDRFDTYADMVYSDVYFRDYTPADAAVMHEWVKTFIVPLLDEMILTIYGEHYSELSEYYSVFLSPEELLEITGPYISTVGSEAAELFELMKELGLFELSRSETKRPGAFTMKLGYYAVPFMYMAPDNYAGDIKTVIHEFGHGLEYYHNHLPQTYQYDCIDVAEIDSQGLEMIMMRYNEELFGPELSEIAMLVGLMNPLSAIVQGCVFDEFQQAALARRTEGTLNTPEEVIELYLDIESGYHGEFFEYYSWGEDWYAVHHTFLSPFYYISYASSATAALGFLIEADNDFDSAVEKYMQLIDMGCDKGFAFTLNSLGLPNPLTEEGCELLSEGLTAYYAEHISA